MTFIKEFYDRFSGSIKILLIVLLGSLIGYRLFMVYMEAQQTTEKIDMSIQRQLAEQRARSEAIDNDYSVKPLVNQHYTPELVKRIKGADESIKILMYLIQPSEYRKNSRRGVYRILNALENALGRGVEVQLIVGTGDAPSPYEAEEHRSVIRRLNHDQFEGYVYPLENSMHAKMVLVDDRVALVGAHNWTWHSLNESHETSVVMEGARRIRPLHQRFQRLFEESKSFYEEREEYK